MTKDSLDLDVEFQRRVWLKEAVRLLGMSALPILLWAMASLQMLVAFLMFLSQGAPIPYPFNLVVELPFPVRYLTSAALSMAVLLPIVLFTFLGPYPARNRLDSAQEA